jgi:hypothetical protein
MLEFFFEFFQMKNFDLHAERVVVMYVVRKQVSTCRAMIRALELDSKRNVKTTAVWRSQN